MDDQRLPRGMDEGVTAHARNGHTYAKGWDCGGRGTYICQVEGLRLAVVNSQMSTHDGAASLHEHFQVVSTAVLAIIPTLPVKETVLRESR